MPELSLSWIGAVPAKPPEVASEVAPEAPSPWLLRCQPWLPPPPARAVDFACGRGRHSRWLAGLGYRVLAVGRDPAALVPLAAVPGIEPRLADLEADTPPFWEMPDLGPAQADLLVVSRYLHRPGLPALADLLRPGGVVVYETFMVGQAAWGRPTRAEFLLESQELLDWARHQGLDVLAYEQGLASVEIAGASPAMLQRLCARRPGPAPG